MKFQRNVIFIIIWRILCLSYFGLNSLQDCWDSVNTRYRGTISQSMNDYDCVRWDSPDLPEPSFARYLEGNASMHKNYCRQPTGLQDIPWCFVVSKDLEWEYCNIPFCSHGSEECLSSIKGLDYFGTESKTFQNIECQRWDKKEPHDHWFFTGFMGLSASEHENYCRNPDNEEMPWCYTVNSTIRFQYCNISRCSEEPKKDCKDTEKGETYQGVKNVTQDGIPCQRWDSSEPHVPNTGIEFVGSNLSAQENYCRNPDDEPLPWCYTMDPNVRFQFCDIPFCLNASFHCDFSRDRCFVKQYNSQKFKWMFEKLEQDNTLAFTLGVNSTSTQTMLPKLKLPFLRPTKTGGCITMLYYSEGAELMLRTAEDDLTLLKESSEWTTVKVNIGQHHTAYQIHIIPCATSGSILIESAIRYIDIEEGHCEDCFPCLEDNLCIENNRFCNMKKDCPDNSDEKNCALECYFENEYYGFRKKTQSLNACDTGTCAFSTQSKGKPGCNIDSEVIWEECNVPECEIKSLSCKFHFDLCHWQQTGIKWNRKIMEETGEMIAIAEMKADNTDITGDKAILYSTIQKPSSDLGCVKITHSGRNADLAVFISQGTVLSPNDIVYQRRGIQSELFLSSSFQTPIGIPFVVIIVATFEGNKTGEIRLLHITYESGICKDKPPCHRSQFQCDDGSCINVDQFCDGILNCPNREDETSCTYKRYLCLQNAQICFETCPPKCECEGFVFKCLSPRNITKNARVLDLSSNSFDITHLTSFSYLIHLNISGCFLNNTLIRGLGYRMNSSHLQNLDLSFNKISSLDISIFEGFSNVLYLNISHNQVKRIEMGFLDAMPKLRHLLLSNNHIDIFPAKEFERFHHRLEFLDLQNNNLKSIMPKALHWFRSLSKLNLHKNSLTNTDFYFSSSMQMLYELDLDFNAINTISDNMFFGLKNLRVLHMQNNNISYLGDFSFSALSSLISLNLAFNRIKAIHKLAFENLVSLVNLNLTGNKLISLSPARFVPLVKLHVLDLSHNGMNVIENNAFNRLEHVKHLYIHNNALIVSKTMFQGLCNLQWMQTDSYIICCAKPLSVETRNCISPKDRISSCEQLINVGFLSQMIWYMALFAVIGNLYVIFYRLRRNQMPQGVFILNLSISDLLMGMYLGIIAIADLEYRNVYGFNDTKWRFSTMCAIAGLLAAVSSESSVVFIFLITIERYFVLKYPFTRGILRNRKAAVGISLIVWVIAIVLAVVPLFVYSDFYSRSTVCISLPLTAERVSGWEFSTFIFIGLNSLFVIAVIIGQILIFLHVRKIGSSNGKDNTEREIAVFKSLSYVVLSDAFCWIPIILIGIFSHTGLDISFDVYAWVIVLVLPINSALNPFIYTFSMIYRQLSKSSSSQQFNLTDRKINQL